MLLTGAKQPSIVRSKFEDFEMPSLFTNSLRQLAIFGAIVMITLAAGSQGAASQQLGIFENHQDVGTVLHPGSASFDAAKGPYTIAGSGENMWFGIDDFHFAWKMVSGDVALTADIAFVGTGGIPHR